MTDIVEELAKLLVTQNKETTGDWERLGDFSQELWRKDARVILRFLEPYIAEREQKAWMDGRVIGVNMALHTV